MKIAGFDVSWGRTSDTACVVWDYDMDNGMAQAVQVEAEVLTTQPEVIEYIAELERAQDFDAIVIDAVGFGRGVLDHLQMMPFGSKVVPFIANTRASREWEDEQDKILVDRQFANWKSRVVWEMRKNAYRGLVRIPSHKRLVEELQQYEMKKVGGRWKVEDPKKSPDVADAAVAGYSATGDFVQWFWLGR